MSQARDGIRANINANPSKLLFGRRHMVDDGFGGLMPDPLGVPDVYKAKVRISHESKSVPQLEQKPVGLGTNLSRFILADHKTQIHEGDRFVYQGIGWEIGVVDTLSFGSEIIGYQAPLKEAEESDPVIDYLVTEA